MDSTFDIERLLKDYGLRKIQERSWHDAALRWLILTEHQRDYTRQKQRLEWLSSHINDKLLSEITDDFVIELGNLKRQQTSASTANRHMALLRAILRAARDDWRWIQWIPRVHFFKEPEHRVRWLLPNEAGRLIHQLPEHLADMSVFTLATGLRQSNVTGLTWRNVDINCRTAWVLSSDSKSKRSFSVPLNDTALEILSKRKNKHRTHVFDYKGKVIGRCSTAAWKKAKLRADIDDFRWHDWRHTWASWHVQSGTSLYELQELGGWKSFEMVLRYAHLSGDQLRVAATRIDQKLNQVSRAVD